MAAKQTGSSGYLIIEDDGGTVTFKIQNTQGATFASGKSWSGTVNGTAVGGTFSISGAQTVTLGSWGVGYSQTVTLNMGATGTSGLGGPSSFSLGIFRATPPATPNAPTVSQITPTSMRLSWSLPNDGGAAIDQMLLRRYDTSNTNSTTYTDYGNLPANTTVVATGLTPAKTYYWKLYAHNARGFSQPSSVVQATTASGAYVSLNGVWVAVPINWSNGSAWTPLAAQVSNGTAWVRPV